MTRQPPPSYDDFLVRATADPTVAGLLLKGSRAHDGTTTEHSDHDVYVSTVVTTRARRLGAVRPHPCPSPGSRRWHRRL
ncbi:MAG: hypothetical protein ACJ736_28800 [Streptomyces sp.]